MLTIRAEQRPYFEAAAEGRLVLPRCGSCGAFHWYPKFRCPHCGAPHWAWTEIGGTGRLFTFTTVRHPFKPGADVPFTVAFVELDEAASVRLVSRLLGVDEPDIVIGMAVEPVYLPLVKDGPIMPCSSLPALLEPRIYTESEFR